jgi:hypothetical protein
MPQSSAITAAASSTAPGAASSLTEVDISEEQRAYHLATVAALATLAMKTSTSPDVWWLMFLLVFVRNLLLFVCDLY